MRFKPFDECPPDDHREFAARANESTQVFRLYQVTPRTRAILFEAQSPLSRVWRLILILTFRKLPLACFHPAPSG